MKSKFNKLTFLIAGIVCIALFQSSYLQADENCRGIGGTGAVANGCGVGGTGNSATQTGIGGTGHSGSESGLGGTGNVASKAGIGGTGHIQGDGGIGGTGHGSESGMGGTGIVASKSGIGGTGIVGIVTGFGSIWVNGLEVQYDAKTPVADNAAVANSNVLAIGQVVTIEASESNHELKANKISVLDAVTGQISSVDENNAKLVVLGQTVSIASNTITHDQQSQQNAIQLKQGDYVKVNGLRLANGEIVASRVERTGIIAEPNLLGPITKINGKVIEVYGLQIVADGDQQLKVGQEILVSGKLTDGKLMAREISLSPVAQLYETTEQIKLQGYVGESTSAGQIKVGNMDVIVSSRAMASKGALTPGDLVQVSGRFAADHRIIADRVEFSRDRPESGQHEHISGQDHDATEKHEHSDNAGRIEMDRQNIDRVDTNDHIDRPEHIDLPDHIDSPNHINSTESMENASHSEGHSGK